MRSAETGNPVPSAGERVRDGRDDQDHGSQPAHDARVSRPVTVTISCRRDGSALQGAGSIPVAFPGWGIKGPTGFGPFGSLADHGIAEFRLVLQRSGGSGRDAGTVG
jgi:hypothetical protein